MRHISLTMALTLATTLTLGCGDDDDTPPTEAGGTAGATAGGGTDSGGSGATDSGGSGAAASGGSAGTGAGGTAGTGSEVDAGPLDPDAGDPCADNGPCDPLTECTVEEGQALCSVCPAGYDDPNANGTECVANDECARGTDNCSSNAVCSDLDPEDGGFLCTCNAGYTGSGVTCTDLNECIDLDNGDDCPVEAVCVNTLGSFTCECDAGFEFDEDLNECQDIDECEASGNDGGCVDPRECVNSATPGVPLGCSPCPTGFVADGDTACIDVDECLTNNGGCGTGVTCSSSGAVVTCGSCPMGMALVNQACEDINECATANGGCPQNCQNAATSGAPAVCSCAAGYTNTNGDGSLCTNIDECTLGTDTCSPVATCDDTEPVDDLSPATLGYDCTCPAGYTDTNGDGSLCTNIDECGGANACATEASCTNTDPIADDDATGLTVGYDCTCNVGFETASEGTVCTVIDECEATDLCADVATCAEILPANDDDDGTVGYDCTCPAGYTDTNANGTVCTNIDECTLETDTCSALATCANTEPVDDLSPATLGYDCTCTGLLTSTDDGVTCTCPPNTRCRTLFVNGAVVGGTNDGSSWANAYSQLHAALDAAQAGDDIWVARFQRTNDNGTPVDPNDDFFETVSYLPASAAAPFVIKTGVRVYGGFLGDGTEVDITDRIASSRPTQLSGDFGDDDDGTDDTRGDNAVHVVMMQSDSVLDGVRVLAGNAAGAGDDAFGGGIFVGASTGVTLNEVVVRRNVADDCGGGLYVADGGSLTLTNSLFAENESDIDGGGVCILGSTAAVDIDLGAFDSNVAGNNGGGLYSTTAVLSQTNLLFVDNFAVGDGGGAYGDLGTVTHVTAYRNSAASGAGFYALSGAIRNSILWGNLNDGLLDDSGSTLTVTFSDVQGGVLLGTGNLSEDPGFVNPSDPTGGDATYGNANDGLRLGDASTVRDQGDDFGVTTSITGRERPADNGFDPGAYEGFVPVAVGDAGVDGGI